MKYKFLRFLISLILSFTIIKGYGQETYLDYAYIHETMNPSGGYNITQKANGDYFVLEQYSNNESDLNPDEVIRTPVYKSALNIGSYLAKYDKNGNYLNHTFIITNKATSNSLPIAADDSFIYFIGEFFNEARFYKYGTFDTLKNNGITTYIAKYNHNLELIDKAILPNDSSLYYADLIIDKKGDLILLAMQRGNTILKLKGQSIPLIVDDKNRLANTWDMAIIRLSSDLIYKNHTGFGVKGSEVANKMQFDKNGNILISGYINFRAKGVIMGDTFPISDNFGFGTNPLILKFNPQLQLIQYHVNNLQTAEDLILHPNGNLLLVCRGNITSQISGLYFVLLDSNLIEKQRKSITSGNTGYYKKSGFINKKNQFSMVVSPSLIFLNDTNVSPTTISLLSISKDSFNFGCCYGLNSFIKEIFHADTQNILSTIQFNGRIEVQQSVNNGPPYTLGEPLINPPPQHTAVCNYNYLCAPVTTYLEFDSQVNCADLFGMNAGRGNVRLVHKGSGAAFQWYDIEKPTFKLIDQKSPLQGGQIWKGTRSSYFSFSVGLNTFFSRQYSAQVGGSCTTPYWSDTATQIIWGAPIMVAKESSKILTLGSSDSIEAFVQDLNYPLDSLEFQWYRGATALIDGLRFSGARTQKLYIKDVKDFDQGVFSCVAYRIHCKDVNSALASSTFVNINPTGFKTLKNSTISIYPNPSNGTINIKLLSNYNLLKVEIFNMIGNLQKQYNEIDETINIEELPSGIYTIRITTDINTYYTQIIKN